MCIPQSHIARTVPQVHDRVLLGLQRNNGNCDHREVGGSRQEVRDRTGKLCEIKGARRQRQCGEWEGRAQQRDAEVRQVGKETDKQVKYYANCVKPLANISRKVVLWS